MKLTMPKLLNGYPAYGSSPVTGFWSERRELREFWTDVRSFVLAKIDGKATDYKQISLWVPCVLKIREANKLPRHVSKITISPGHTSRSRFAPSVTQLLPLVIVALLYLYFY